MAAFLFPTQGSQHKGQGQNLFERFPEYTRQVVVKKIIPMLADSEKDLLVVDIEI